MSTCSDNPVAVITGASSGIGKGVASYFLERKYHVVLIGRNLEALEALRAEFPDAKASILNVDLRDHVALEKNMKTMLTTQGRVDVLVNSAGYVKRGTTTLARDEFVNMLETNLVGVFDVTRSIVPIMKKRSAGRIINISSYSAVVAKACLGGYAASKFGLMGWNESLHKELAPHGIDVTAICPNLVDTDMTKDVTSIERDELVPVADVVNTIDYLMRLTPNVMVKELVLRCRAALIKTIDR